MPQRVLIINLHYPPDTGATAPIIEEVAAKLATRFQVSIVAGRPSYNPEQRHGYYLFRREVKDGVTVERVGTTAYHRRRMLGRLANYITYLALATIRVVIMRPRPDIVIAMTDPPLAVLVGAIGKIFRRWTLVYNIRDLHPDMAISSGVVRQNLFVKLWDRLHRWALRKADLVITLGDDMRQRVLEKGLAESRVVVVRDGTPETTTATSNNPVAKELGSTNAFVLLHAGNLGYAGAWHTLIEAVKLMESEDVGLVFVGDGAAGPELREAAQGYQNIRFFPFRPANEIPLVMAAGHIHVVTLRSGLEGLVVPSKLYTTLAAGRPVLAIAPETSDVAKIVSAAKCGFVADPNDPASVVAAVRSAIADQELLLQMSARAKQIAKEFSRETQLEKFSALLEYDWTTENAPDLDTTS